ncbi:hypothetical protein GCM10027258_19100 [Amycolatopsis stemonae]
MGAVVGGPLVAGALVAARAVVGGPVLAARAGFARCAVFRGPVFAGPVVAAAAVARGWAVLADRALVADRGVFGWELARASVAGRLAAAALRWRRRLLAAGRLGRSRRPVSPLRGRSAFAPRTTRTLGW